jgi:Skp family chaperone for outer membrane proteins
VKKQIAVLMGLSALGVGAYVGGRAWAQGTQPANPPRVAPLQTRVGLINVGLVIKSYNKFKVYQDQMKREMEPLQKEIEQKKQLVTAKQNQAADPKTTVQAREQLEKEVKAIQREIQDKVDDANNRFAKDRVNQLVTIYKDVQAAVTAYARSRGFELVMQYSDSTDPAEKYSAASLQQKLGNMACFPVYHHEQMEITNDVLDMLNRGGSTAAAPPASPAPAGQPH